MPLSNERRRIEELSLIDDFMFTEASVDKDTAQILLRLIIKRATGLSVGKLVIESQKTINGVDTDRHGIRLDVTVGEIEMEGGRTVQLFDIEPNNIESDDLPRRSRYYEALTDVKVLETGTAYDKIPDLWMIWILPYDPFEMDHMIYSVRNRVEEFPKIDYNDGVRKLFLYTGGTNGGTEALKNLLAYIQNSIAENVVDEELKELHSNVERLKGKKEIGVKYMHVQEMMDRRVKAEVDKVLKETLDKAVKEKLDEAVKDAVDKTVVDVTQKVTKDVTQKVTIEVTENTEQRMAKLIDILIKENRIEDLKRMTADKDYRKKLLADFGLS